MRLLAIVVVNFKELLTNVNLKKLLTFTDLKGHLGAYVYIDLFA